MPLYVFARFLVFSVCRGNSQEVAPLFLKIRIQKITESVFGVVREVAGFINNTCKCWEFIGFSKFEIWPQNL